MNGKTVLVTGGSGFLGSYLCEKLLDQGNDVVCLDNFYTGAKRNIMHLLSNPHFETFVTDELKQEPERTKSPAEAVAALKAGRVEFVIADIDPAKNCVKGEDSLAISDFITSEEYAIAIKKGQPELLKTINETIAEVKADGRLEKWVKEFTEESDKLKEK